MYTIRMPVSKSSLNSIRLYFNYYKKKVLLLSAVNYYATTTDIDIVTNYFIEKYRNKQIYNMNDSNCFFKRHFMDRTENIKDVSNLNQDEISKRISDLLAKNKDAQLEQMLLDCRNVRKFIGELSLNKLFRHYSTAGKPNMIEKLQKYCYKTDNNLYKRSGEFTHYLAKAECLRGNSAKGLALLKDCYQRYEALRSFYRIIFRELIQDSVMNRSEASLVVFKKYVIQFSETWNDNYPLICLWHVCWTSNWFSDQMLADELLEQSGVLQEIIRDKSVAFSITVLRDNYNDDAVFRLLQCLLKYEMMNEYTKVLHVLFNFKLRNRDLRGCTEILKNCEILGITLSANQKGKYINMLIRGLTNTEYKQPDTPSSKDIKFKF